VSYAKLYWIHALTPLHVGSGQGLGFIDLPIMREKATSWPLVPGSSVKGAWRALVAAGKHNELENTIFGVPGESEGHAGSVVIGDANIAFFPVRSLYGTFAYVTTPLVLRRIQRDSKFAAPEELTLPDLEMANNEALVSDDSCLQGGGRVYLEDLDLNAQASQGIGELAERLAAWIFPGDDNAPWRSLFKQRFLVVPGTVFDYLTTHATEVVARIRLDENKTVATRALWNQESLPAETILVGVLWCDRVLSRQNGGLSPEELLDTVFHGEWPAQLGGNQTIGLGRVRCVFGAGREV